MQVAPPTQLPEYSGPLIERLGEAVFVQRARVRVGEWVPVAHDCHVNVGEFCSRCSGYTHIRGWLYFDFGGYALLNAHSVVQDPDGKLIDITPTLAESINPFIVDLNSPNEYDRLIRNGAVRLLHRT